MAIISKSSIVRALSLVDISIKIRSFTKTADELRMKQSNVSTYIREFEDFLGVKLFSKTSYGVTPTQHCLELQKISDEMQAVFNKVHNFSEIAHSITGDINLWTTDGIGNYLIPYLASFQNCYPDVNVNIICSNNLPNFGKKEADVAIVYNVPKANEPVKFNGCPIKFGLFASPGYIARFGTPKDLEDIINNHRIIDRKEYVDIWETWRDIIDRSPNVVGYFDTTSMLVEATKNGMGIALHPLNYGKTENGLVFIDINLELIHTCWVVYHHDDKNNPKIQAVLNHIEECMNKLQK